MKIFLSWSGNSSREIAKALREWIPSVIQQVEAYVSSEDIRKGARWAVEISSELEGSSFGILCIVPGNSDAPWIAFEAGALSKSLKHSHVIPLLIGVGREELSGGPLAQFQSALFDCVFR